MDLPVNEYPKIEKCHNPNEGVEAKFVHFVIPAKAGVRIFKKKNLDAGSSPA